MEMKKEIRCKIIRKKKIMIEVGVWIIRIEKIGRKKNKKNIKKIVKKRIGIIIKRI